MGTSSSSKSTVVTPLPRSTSHQGILHGRPKATNLAPKTFVDPLQTKRFGTNRLEIHRYHLQIRTRSIPDYQRKTKVYGTTQKGKARLRRYRKLDCSKITSFVQFFVLKI